MKSELIKIGLIALFVLAVAVTLWVKLFYVMLTLTLIAILAFVVLISCNND
jgi:hypothetical protein